MKKNFLLIVAVCFVSAIALFVSATHVLDERSARPVFSKVYSQQTPPPKVFKKHGGFFR